MEQAHKDNRNFHIAYIDYRNAFDAVSHSWLVRLLEVDQLIINSLQKLMKKWTTTFEGKVKENWLRVTRFAYSEEYIKGIVLAPYGSALH
jgi:hypothetical protein